MQGNNTSSYLRQFQAKMRYFYLYDGIFGIWSLLALVYFIVNTVDVGNLGCHGMKLYFIGWTISYAVQLLTAIASAVVVSNSRYYTVAYTFIVSSILYKIVVVGSLLIGAWKHVGLCFIPYTFRLIIVLTNSLEVLCLLILFVLVWRIKAVNREILVEKLIMTKTFAEN